MNTIDQNFLYFFADMSESNCERKSDKDSTSLNSPIVKNKITKSKSLKMKSPRVKAAQCQVMKKRKNNKPQNEQKKNDPNNEQYIIDNASEEEEENIDIKELQHFKNQIIMYNKREHTFKRQLMRISDYNDPFYNLNILNVFRQIKGIRNPESCCNKYLEYYRSQTTKQSLVNKFKIYSFTQEEYDNCRLEYEKITKLESKIIKQNQKLIQYQNLQNIFNKLESIFQKIQNYQQFQQNIQILNKINEINAEIAFEFCNNHLPSQIFHYTAQRANYFFIKNIILHLITDITFLDSQC